MYLELFDEVETLPEGFQQRLRRVEGGGKKVEGGGVEGGRWMCGGWRCGGWRCGGVRVGGWEERSQRLR